VQSMVFTSRQLRDAGRENESREFFSAAVGLCCEHNVMLKDTRRVYCLMAASILFMIAQKYCPLTFTPGSMKNDWHFWHSNRRRNMQTSLTWSMRLQTVACYTLFYVPVWCMYTVSQKKTSHLWLAITLTHVNGFWYFLAEMLPIK